MLGLFLGHGVNVNAGTTNRKTALALASTKIVAEYLLEKVRNICLLWTSFVPKYKVTTGSGSQSLLSVGRSCQMGQS